MNDRLSILLCLTFFLFGTFSPMAQEQEAAFAQPIQEFPFTAAVYLQEPPKIQSTLHFFNQNNRTWISPSISNEIEDGFTNWLQNFPANSGACIRCWRQMVLLKRRLTGTWHQA